VRQKECSKKDKTLQTGDNSIKKTHWQGLVAPFLGRKREKAAKVSMGHRKKRVGDQQVKGSYDQSREMGVLHGLERESN